MIFTTNLNGFANFELYIVDAKGTGQPVRVTFTDGFDGLPVFSPDGKKLCWKASGRTAGGASQIYIAHWNNDHALAALKGTAKSTAAAPAPKPANQPSMAQTTAAITPADLRQGHVTYLASDALMGRLTGTEGERLATQYVADAFKEIGLLPFGDDDGWFDGFNSQPGSLSALVMCSL